MYYRNSQPVCRQNRGFSLVELMVGMTIGLLVVIVIMQSFSVFETQKRTTTAGSDAQSSGLMAMTQLEQEVRNAGGGFTSDSAFSCNTIFSYFDDGTTVTTPVPAFSSLMAPVVITDGGTGSDTITIKRGTNFLGSIPASITSAMPNTSAILDVSFTQGFAAPNKIMLSQNGNCTIMEITSVLDAALKIQHNPGGGGASWNPPGSFYNTSPGNTWPGAGGGPPNYSTGTKILNVGELFVKTYSVNANNNLQVLDSSTNIPGGVAVTYPLVKDIVSLQAEYGVSSGAGVQPVSNWVSATGTWSALDSAEIKRIKAIRLTLVARSSKKEITDVTTAPPGGVNVSNLTDWQKYRYRVYTTIIPLRNIIWSNI